MNIYPFSKKVFYTKGQSTLYRSGVSSGGADGTDPLGLTGWDIPEPKFGAPRSG